LGKLGKGAFASVYLTRPATGPPDGPHCVVKVIQLQAQPRPGHLAAQASEARPPGPLINAKLKRAAEKEASFLKHVGGLEHCVSAFDFAIEGTLAYIVMERCDLTLLRLLEQLPSLREASLARIFSEMCQALASIHGLGIVHRDIKPDNFLCVGEASTIKLCDFGLAEGESRGSDQGLTGVYGTAPFMSPEMLSGTGYDSKTDLWSLGVIMYVICLGQFPYIPAKTSASAMKAAILVGVPAPSFRPKTSLDLSNGSPISECLKDLIRELLERDCAARATADHALRHEWFSPGAERTTFPLRPMLYSAKRVGAFDVGAAPVEDALDVELKGLQAQYHREGIAVETPCRRPHPGGAQQPDGGGRGGPQPCRGPAATPTAAR